MIKRMRVKNTPETQIWNDAADFFSEMVGRGEELVIPVLPGRTLTSMYVAMRAALIRRGSRALVRQCPDSRYRHRAMGGYVASHYGRPSLVLTHRMPRAVDAKQYNFFDHHGGAVVYFNEEPFYGVYVGEEGEKLVFSLIWNDDEKIVKFGKAYCNKVGQYTWLVRG